MVVAGRSKPRRIRLAAVGLVSGLMVMAIPLIAEATMCGGGGEPGTPEHTRRLLETYPVVFVGRVSSIEPVYAPTPTPSPTATPGPTPVVAGELLSAVGWLALPKYTRVTFEVRRVFQGVEHAQHVTLRTEPWWSPFRADSEYLVFAKDDGHGRDVGPCNPSQRAEDARELIQSLAEETRARRAP